MDRSRPCYYCLLLLLLLPLLGVTWGCGRKTRPVPPQTVVPVPINDLRYSLDEKGVTLAWSFPRRMENGAALTGIDGFEILRAVVSEDDYCKECPLAFGDPIIIKGGSSTVNGASRTGRYTEALLRPRHRYFFKVRTVTGWYAGRASNMIYFVWDKPVGAPLDLRIKAGDQALILSWQPPTAFLDGTPVVGPLTYRVYRRSEYAAAGEGFRLLAKAVADPVFTDTSVVNGSRYYYNVRAVRQYKETLLVGAAGRVVAGVPRDLTPPAPPEDLAVVRTAVGVKIFWEEVRETDLAGYRVYRRGAAGRPAVLIGTVPAPALIFVDDKPPVGKGPWYYAVTAFDRAAPPNESPLSREVIMEDR